MILSDQDLRARLDDPDDDFDVTPLDDEQVQPASIDLRLGDEALLVANPRENRPIDSTTLHNYDTKLVPIDEDGLTIKPGFVYLPTTRETVTLPADLGAEVKGRSSIGRLGVSPHTAGWVDPGFEGELTLECSMVHTQPVTLYPGQRVCQIVVKELKSTSDTPYGSTEESKYQDQTGATASKANEDGDI